MRRRRVLTVWLAVAAFAPAARAAPVVVLGSHGGSWVAQDRWLPATG